ncbi:MAG: helix-turn-helix domain-containing protein [Planctomycetaceae bacterium]
MSVVIDKQFRDIVNDRLAALGWNRSDLARAMGKGPAYVTDYLNGRAAPGPDVMEHFFSALGLAARLNVEVVDEPAKRPLQTAG